MARHETMLTRGQLAQMIQERFNLEGLSSCDRLLASTSLCEVLLSEARNVTEMARLILTDDRFEIFHKYPQAEIAEFLRASEATVSAAKAQCLSPELICRPQGRPTALTIEAELALTNG
jgi:hypothetical protein